MNSKYDESRFLNTLFARSGAVIDVDITIGAISCVNTISNNSVPSLSPTRNRATATQTRNMSEEKKSKSYLYRFSCPTPTVTTCPIVLPMLKSSYSFSERSGSYL